MAKDPLDRSSAATLLQHPFVASLTTPDEGTVPVESMISEIQSIGPALLHYRELEKLWNSDCFLDFTHVEHYSRHPKTVPPLSVIVDGNGTWEEITKG